MTMRSTFPNGAQIALMTSCRTTRVTYLAQATDDCS